MSLISYHCRKCKAIIIFLILSPSAPLSLCWLVTTIAVCLSPPAHPSKKISCHCRIKNKTLCSGKVACCGVSNSLTVQNNGSKEAPRCDMVPFCRKVFNSHRHPDITAVVEQCNRKNEDMEKLLERQVRHSAEHLLK